MLTPEMIDLAASKLRELKEVDALIADWDTAVLSISMTTPGGYAPVDLPDEVTADHAVHQAVIDSLERKRAGIIRTLHAAGVTLRGEYVDVPHNPQPGNSGRSGCALQPKALNSSDTTTSQGGES